MSSASLMASLDLGAGGRLLPPVQDKQLLEPLQKDAGDLLHLGALLSGQLRRRAGQDVEDDQLFFGHVLANVPFLLLGQVVAQLHQFLEQLLDAPAACVIARDQLLESLSEVGAGPVEP